MRIFFNDQHIETGSVSLFELLDEQHLAGKNGIAVAVNDEVIPRTRWEETPLAENYNVLVITAAAGG